MNSGDQAVLTPCHSHPSNTKLLSTLLATARRAEPPLKLSPYRSVLRELLSNSENIDCDRFLLSIHNALRSQRDWFSRGYSDLYWGLYGKSLGLLVSHRGTSAISRQLDDLEKRFTDPAADWPAKAPIIGVLASIVEAAPGAFALLSGNVCFSQCWRIVDNISARLRAVTGPHGVPHTDAATGSDQPPHPDSAISHLIELLYQLAYQFETLPTLRLKPLHDEATRKVAALIRDVLHLIASSSESLFVEGLARWRDATVSLCRNTCPPHLQHPDTTQMFHNVATDLYQEHAEREKRVGRRPKYKEVMEEVIPLLRGRTPAAGPRKRMGSADTKCKLVVPDQDGNSTPLKGTVLDVCDTRLVGFAVEVEGLTTSDEDLVAAGHETGENVDVQFPSREITVSIMKAPNQTLTIRRPLLQLGYYHGYKIHELKVDCHLLRAWRTQKGMGFAFLAPKEVLDELDKDKTWRQYVQTLPHPGRFSVNP